MPRSLLALLLAVLALGVAACGDDDSSDSGASTAQETATPAKATGTSETAGRVTKPSSGGVYRRLAMSAYYPDHLMLWGVLAALRCVWLGAATSRDEMVSLAASIQR